MIVAFKNKGNEPDLANRLIGIWTRSEWVHCEMLLSTPYRVAISARTSDGVTPVAWASVLVNSSQWECYEVPVSSDSDVWAFLMSQAGNGFNFSGLLAGQIFHSSIPRPDSWFCSELTYSVIGQYALIDLPTHEPVHVSPALLREYLIQANCAQININTLLNSQ